MLQPCSCLGCLVWSRRCWIWPVLCDGWCWLSSYLALCLLHMHLSCCRQTHSNRAPHQITNIRSGGGKQNKAICKWLGCSVKHHTVIILTQNRRDAVHTPFLISCWETTASKSDSHLLSETVTFQCNPTTQHSVTCATLRTLYSVPFPSLSSRCLRL